MPATSGPRAAGSACSVRLMPARDSCSQRSSSLHHFFASTEVPQWEQAQAILLSGLGKTCTRPKG